ncbi:hypothetical protein CVT26_000059 [Gymnopilus dilepis]|uniref:Uncharacterized protein n=1 Tax=Gymnopilus dilepis TaxID=231916 RepID=A0A409VGF4_9AGAR|nr:hypothetical protein CVT26_000059 [Gymnopilus dilepis]
MWQALKRIFCCSSAPTSDELYEKAQAFFNEYQNTKSLHDLKKAIDNYREALVARRKENNPDEGHILVNYATALWNRYERAPGSARELEEIIRLYEGADEEWSREREKPEGYPDLLLDLGNAYYTKSLVVIEDAAVSLDKAIEFLERLDLDSNARLPPETRVKGMVMLGTALNRRCTLHKMTDRLDEAIDLLKRSSDSLARKEWTDGMPDNIRFLCLNNLATAYNVRYRYNKPQDPRDLDNAIEYSRRALAALPSGHGERGTTSFNLATQLYKRYELVQKRGAEQLLASGLDAREGVQDLNDAFEMGLEAQRLLRGTGHSASVERLLEVIKVHREALSRTGSRATTPNLNEA